MKRSILLIITALFIFTGCDNPTMPTGTPVETNELLGQWIRNDEVITFYNNGDFTFHDYYTLEEYYYGFYIDYGDSVYLEVYEDGANMTYEYVIVIEGAETILRWKSSGMINTVDYLKM